MPTCTNCRSLLDDDASFCSSCGVVQPADEKEPSQEQAGKIYLHRFGQQEGPYTMEEVKASFRAGNFQADDQAWIEGTSSWVSLSSLPGIDETKPSVSASLIANPLVTASAPSIVLSGLPVYYQEEFRKIAESNEAYKGKWNWAAALFTCIWAFTKGVWLAPLIWMTVFTVVIFISCGVGVVIAPVFWVLFGLRGNYMYYCASQKNQQIVI